MLGAHKKRRDPKRGRAALPWPNRAPPLRPERNYCLRLLPFEEALELISPAGVTQLTQGFGFNLSDALSGHPENLPHLFKGTRASIIKAETQAQHFLFAGGQCIEDILQLFPQKFECRGLGRCLDFLIFDKIP